MLSNKGVNKINIALEKMKIQFNHYKLQGEKLELYAAGLPKFNRLFTRDLILSSFLLQDTSLLKNTIILCSLLQGKEKNRFTGEEPGKIFHEYPGVKIPGREHNLTTLYNACDTTALYLLAHSQYIQAVRDFSLLKTYEKEIEKAISYILSHINEKDLFAESPAYCGARQFALKVTYWKDSVLVDRKDGEPAYPVVYALAHLQNAYALLSISEIIKDNMLKDVAEKLFESFFKWMYDEEKGFAIAWDREGKIYAPSSDILHMLYYIPIGCLSVNQISHICKVAMELETNIGFRTLSETLANRLENGYHAKTVWPFEQAFIYLGAKKHGIEYLQNTSKKIHDWLKKEEKEGRFPELVVVEKGMYKMGGCEVQLWTIGAKKMFDSILA
jgi:glycogen debranching enzyme